MTARCARLLVVILVVLLVVAAGPLLLRGDLWHTLTNQEVLAQSVGVLGAWGPAAIVLAEILQVLLAPVPGQVVGIVAGYLYGAFWASVLCTMGLAIGTLIAIWLARRLGRPLLIKIASEELVNRVDNYARRRGALAFFLIFLLPFLPDDVCCFIAGLTPLRIGEVVILAIVGRAPGLIVSTLIGAQAKKLTWPQIAVVGVAGAALAILFIRYQDRLEQAIFGLLDRFSANQRGKAPGRQEPDTSHGGASG